MMFFCERVEEYRLEIPGSANTELWAYKFKLDSDRVCHLTFTLQGPKLFEAGESYSFESFYFRVKECLTL